MLINQAEIDLFSIVADVSETRPGSPINLKKFNESIINFEKYDEQMANQRQEIST